jgi:hypothetical protein
MARDRVNRIFGWLFTAALIATITVFLVPLQSGCHPYTKVGAVGYENVGYEKQLEGSVVTDTLGLPVPIDSNADGKADAYLFNFKVHNDATKAYEFSTMQWQSGVELAKELIGLAKSYMAMSSGGIGGGSVPTTGTTQPSGAIQKLDEALSHPVIGPIIRKIAADNGIVIPESP